VRARQRQAGRPDGWARVVGALLIEVTRADGGTPLVGLNLDVLDEGLMGSSCPVRPCADLHAITEDRAIRPNGPTRRRWLPVRAEGD
jgi:hypothetical protein